MVDDFGAMEQFTSRVTRYPVITKCGCAQRWCTMVHPKNNCWMVGEFYRVRQGIDGMIGMRYGWIVGFLDATKHGCMAGKTRCRHTKDTLARMEEWWKITRYCKRTWRFFATRFQISLENLTRTLHGLYRNLLFHVHDPCTHALHHSTNHLYEAREESHPISKGAA